MFILNYKKPIHIRIGFFVNLQVKFLKNKMYIKLSFN